jgi:hypothetical protein
MESDVATIRNWPARLVATLGLIAAMLVIDVGLGYRKLATGNSDEQLEGVHEAHPTLGWAPRPASRGSHVSPGNFSVVYGIDERGLRRVTNRGQATSRLWLFGDSFTFGHGVADADTYSSVMAREWLAPGVHVVNAGVMGYGISQQLQRLIELAERIGPGDSVVFAPISSDVERSLKRFRYASKHLFQSSKGRIESYPDLRDGELVTAELDTLANRAWALVYHARFTGRGLQRLYETFRPSRHVEEAKAMIELARSIAAGRGASFALLFLPHPQECLSQSYRTDLSSFDFPDLKGYFPDDPEGIAAIHFPGDRHWNARGHSLAARAMVGALISEGVMRPSQLLADPPAGAGAGVGEGED